MGDFILSLAPWCRGMTFLLHIRPLRLACLVALLILATSGTVEYAAAEGPPAGQTPDDSSRENKLERRDALGKLVQELRDQDKTDEAVDKTKEMLEIEREVYGDKHEEVSGSLALLS
ncbi:MAG: hypothetical protein N2C12_00955, partial [Planctomycetales bacterium]